MKTTTICQGCWEQRHVPIPIRGPLTVLFKPLGIKISKMHPNLCTICESQFRSVIKQKQITLPMTILFADLRGYTELSQKTEAARVNSLLNDFYDQCASAIWQKEGIINKFIGDAVLAIFNFPLVRTDHVKNAVGAAVQLQKNCVNLKNEIGLAHEHSLGVGIGIHTGDCVMGEFGTSYKDFTAIGPVVNMASRIQGAAAAGEIVLTEEVYQQVRDDFPNAQNRTFNLKGIAEPVSGYIISKKDVLVSV